VKRGKKDERRANGRAGEVCCFSHFFPTSLTSYIIKIKSIDTFSLMTASGPYLPLLHITDIRINLPTTATIRNATRTRLLQPLPCHPGHPHRRSIFTSHLTHKSRTLTRRIKRQPSSSCRPSLPANMGESPNSPWTTKTANGIPEIAVSR
jgi:hypothetical protein